MELKITDQQKHFNSAPEVSAGMGKNIDRQKALNAAREFETLLTSYMLKSMNETTGGMFGSRETGGGDFYEMIFMNEIAAKFSEGKGLGIAKILYRKITGEDIPSVNQSSENSLQIFQLNRENLSTPPVKPGSGSLRNLIKYEGIINEAAEKFGIDGNIIKSVILAESAGNEKALSKADAKGLMQLLDSTAEEMGVNNIWNARDNILGGTKYLSTLLRQYNGNLDLALAGYNAGPGNVEKFKGIPPFEETKEYIKRVTGFLNHFNGIKDGSERINLVSEQSKKESL